MQSLNRWGRIQDIETPGGKHPEKGVFFFWKWDLGPVTGVVCDFLEKMDGALSYNPGMGAQQL